MDFWLCIFGGDVELIYVDFSMYIELFNVLNFWEVVFVSYMFSCRIRVLFVKKFVVIFVGYGSCYYVLRWVFILFLGYVMFLLIFVLFEYVEWFVILCVVDW